MSSDKPRRTIKLETRFGSSRESRSRKDRPCDVCRHRKSACVIAVKPPCRFCEIRGLQCTFASRPRPRRRGDAAPSDQGDTPIENAASSEQLASTPQDQVSPQASRFPIPPEPPGRGTDAPFSSSPKTPAEANATRPYSRQMLSLQQLTSEAEIPSTTYAAIPTRPQAQDAEPHVHYEWEEARLKNSLERGKNVTAHFVGISGEQDTNLFASIRYNVLNETRFIDFNIRMVYEGDSDQGTPPVHFSIVNDTFPERDKKAKILASDAIESHVRGHGDALLRLYFRFVHPIFPVLSKAHIMNEYATDKLAIPASLRGVIYGLGCALWTQDPALKHAPPISQSELFEHAHAALNRELDSPKLATLQTCLLILHEQPDASGTTESPRIWTLACQATGCAQSVGLHQDPTNWKIPHWEKKLRKKLWWATYVTDLWTSICHGQTPHIVDGTWDTSDLDINDLMSDEDVAGVPGEQLLAEQDRTFDPDSGIRFLELVRATKTLSGIVGNAFTLSGYKQAIQKTDITAREAQIWKCKISVDQSLLLIPRSLTMDHPGTPQSPNMNAHLHLGIFALKFLIYRALMSPATPESKQNPASRLCYYYNEALAEGEALMRFMGKLMGVDLHVFWPRHSRTNLILAGNHLIYLFFCASTEAQVAKAYSMLEKYRDILREMAKSADWSTIGLIRPSLLRTESFFHGAAEGIKKAGRP
ncbi:uncharacterized protein PAC_10587 [Phialocephala subalpina]|uniref:Zn(2)-C6 fungal-type domain-containing protein n=1 Tax=Phialocephala subalpina TaxID=576137 RepID=A0A1L7X6P1_9HELO|nr:uncharacterized protein PAC_10587 [Phialocephala subalpina]